MNVSESIATHNTYAVHTLFDSIFTCHSFSEFNSLHERMKVTFSTRVLPSLPKKIYFGRSQVRSVAKQRMKDLEIYIQVSISIVCCT